MTEHAEPDRFTFVSIAMDAQGAKAAQPWHAKAGATFRTLVDQESILAHRWGFRAIPNVWVIDEDGVLQFEQITGFHISRPEDQEKLLSALRREGAAPQPGLVDEEAGLPSYGPGARLIESGQAGSAIEQWFDIVQKDPLNFLVRKQIWQYLYPDRFTPTIDAAWQAEHRALEDRIGVREANSEALREKLSH